MNVSSGYLFKNSQVIKESYSFFDGGIIVNLDRYHYLKVMKEMCLLIPEPCFLIIEAPLSMDMEKKYRKNDESLLHKGIYYADNLNQESVKTIFEAFGDFDSCFQIGVFSIREA